MVGARVLIEKKIGANARARSIVIDRQDTATRRSEVFLVVRVEIVAVEDGPAPRGGLVAHRCPIAVRIGGAFEQADAAAFLLDALYQDLRQDASDVEKGPAALTPLLGEGQRPQDMTCSPGVVCVSADEEPVHPISARASRT